MNARFLSFVLASALVSAGGCGGKDANAPDGLSDGGPPPSSPPANTTCDVDGCVGQDEDRPLVPASKVDILLVVDNSASMTDKSSLLANSLGTLLRNVGAGRDVHLGVISSSLGSFGGDVCDEELPEMNGHGRLRTKGDDGNEVSGMVSGVLLSSGADLDTFVSRAQSLVRGVGQNGCGFEAQLESMYRFLVQPDPWSAVRLDGVHVTLDGVDDVLLEQRRAFLRPDSALVVLMVTDEDDSSVDPLSVDGQGWAFEMMDFPGSPVTRAGGVVAGRTAPHGTTACATDPGSASCTSCALAHQDPSCQENGGYYPADGDELNVRFYDMKRRFGVDPQFPIQRYIDGLTQSVVPDRDAEHVTTNDVTAPYSGTGTCTNPIFAAKLPVRTQQTNEELCHLSRGPRSRELVLLAVLGGVPKALATATPDWEKIVGHNPAQYDETGIDPHMIQSVEPRAGLPGPSEAATDPVHGREYDTKKKDLQYACTFALATPRTCSAGSASCDCAPDSELKPPLCGAAAGQQVRAKAYPTIRPLRVVQGLGERGVVGSVCADTYSDALDRLNQRLSSRLAP